MKERKKKNQLLLLFIISLFLFITANANESEQQKPTWRKHFVLIHGAGHGAWSWYKLVALLRSSGHNVMGLELAASGIDPKQVKDIPSISDYFTPLMDFMASLLPHEGVVLVAHSFGGLAISKAVESFPDKISVAVFVTAIMPGPTLNISTLNRETSSNKDFLRWMIYKNPPDQVEEISNSDHMVMISRPVEPFVRLLRIADNYS